MEKSYYVVVSPNTKKCKNSVFHSSTPASAASKAYTHCIRTKSSKGKSHRISVKKRGGEKIMRYSVREIRAPRDVMRDGVLVHYRYKTKVKSLQ